MCDITSQEFWIKTQIVILTNFEEKTYTLDFKVSLSTTFTDLRMIIIKAGINFWIANTSHTDLHYFIYNIRFKTTKSKLNLDFEHMETTQNFIELDKCK